MGSAHSMPAPFRLSAPCSFSQEHPEQNRLLCLDDFLFPSSCEMGYTSATHASVNKNLLLPVAYLVVREHLSRPADAHPPHIYTYTHDPLTYYIYGLRKIVV
ncbi:MAG: hypothetical protein LBN24_08920 [Mediterranea sp.]|nr:hypothetical protein [Mediterranea sp.]